MANTYEWVFPSLDVTLSDNNLSNIVNNIHWRLIGTDEATTTTGLVIGTCPISYNPNSEFIEFANLTQQQLEQWVIDSIGEAEVTKFKSEIDSQINKKANPVTATLNPPWMPPRDPNF